MKHCRIMGIMSAAIAVVCLSGCWVVEDNIDDMKVDDSFISDDSTNSPGGCDSCSF